MEILYGGIPGRPIGDGMDGHSWWPLFENIPTEYLEAYYPLRIDGYTTVTDSGGPGFHRGGNGVEKRYVYLEPGEVSIHDDRWLTRPWGVLGGWPGARSSKLLVRADGSEQVLPSKCDNVAVEPGDMLVYRTAGGGGWKDRLERPVEAVVRDVSFGLVSREFAREGYGVVIGDDGTADEEATEAERARQREERGEALAFDFGPPLDDVLAGCEAETGLAPPKPAKPLRWSPLEPGDVALSRVREGDGNPRADVVDAARGLPWPGGLRAASGAARRRRQRGFTDPASPLVCDLDGVVGRSERCSGVPAGGASGRLHDGRVRRRGQTGGGRLHREGSRPADARGRQPWVEIDPRIAPDAGEAVLVKSFASAFFGTSLASMLAAAGCDSVVVTGASTSGCVRATAVDALQHGYRVIVPREAVGDRNPAAHEANLYDLDTKYADVVSLDEVMDALAGTGSDGPAAATPSAVTDGDG